MPVNRRENTLRCYRFQRPASIPVRVCIPPQAWLAYDPRELAEILGAHPILFPDFEPGSAHARKLMSPPHQRPGERYTDGWGCVREAASNGLEPTVVKHPVASWDQLPKLHCPDPAHSDGMRSLDWDQLKRHAETCWRRKELLQFDLPAGHTLLRLRDLRGYENLMFDMLDDHPDLSDLIRIVTDFNVDLVRRFVDLEPDIIGIPEDLGLQDTPLISPEQFRTYIKPSYEAIAKPAKERGVLVHHRCGGVHHRSCRGSYRGGRGHSEHRRPRKWVGRDPGARQGEGGRRTGHRPVRSHADRHAAGD